MTLRHFLSSALWLLTLGCQAHSSLVVGFNSLPAFSGSWRSQCYPEMQIDASTYREVTISTSKLSTRDYFFDPNLTCETADLYMITETHQIFHLPQPEPNSEVDDPQKVDFQNQRRLRTIVRAELISEFNAQNHCGFSNWVVNEPKDISASADCGFDREYEFSIYQSVNGQLLFGVFSSELDGSSDSKRPNQVSKFPLFRW